MPNGHLPSKDFRWPVTEAEMVTERLGETIGQLRRNRDELLAALEDLVSRLKRNGLISEKDAYEYDPLIARIKGGG
jgi:hypothetical protein